MTNYEWFKQAKFGMMIHFGLYSLSAGEWKGRRMPHIGEWAQSYFRIPNKEYEELAKAFNPVLFNAEEWVLTAKEAGMEYLVVTSKHHEGFCLFKSEYDKFNICDGTPFKRDMIAELAEACYKHNIKLGLYYSQELDWHEKDGGGYSAGRTNCGEMSWTNDWDFPNNEEKDFTRCFNTKIKTQFKEILTKYGDLCLIWCDTPFDITKEQSMELYDMIKKYQPNALVSSRIGNGVGDYHSCADNEIDFVADESLNKNKLFECPATLNDTWGFKYFDNAWKNPDTVLEIKEKLNANGINYLLNIGPDHLGRLPAPAVEILKKVGRR